MFCYLGEKSGGDLVWGWIIRLPIKVFRPTNSNIDTLLKNGIKIMLLFIMTKYTFIQCRYLRYSEVQLRWISLAFNDSVYKCYFEYKFITLTKQLVPCLKKRHANRSSPKVATFFCSPKRCAMFWNVWKKYRFYLPLKFSFQFSGTEEIFANLIKKR